MTTSVTVHRGDVTPEWDTFVGSVTGDVLAQSGVWARTKSSRFTSSVVTVREADRISAGCLMMRTRLGPAEVLYAPRGPLFAPGSEHLASAVVDAITAEMKRRQLGVILLQPVSESPALVEAMDDAGFDLAPIDITTPATVEVPLADDVEDLFAALRSSRRRNIRRAERAGLVVRRGSEEDLDSFLELHRNTAKRQGFQPLTHEYLTSQWVALGRAGLMDVYLAELNCVALSAATVTTFGDRVVFKLAGLSDDPDARNLRASDYLHWRIMVESKERGFAYYDLGGFDKSMARFIVAGQDPPDELRGSASQFKLGFGGRVRILPEARWRLSPGAGRVVQGFAADRIRRHDALRTRLMGLRD